MSDPAQLLERLPISSPVPPLLPDEALLCARSLYKGFTLHNQGGIHFPVLEGVSLTVKPGDCVALEGASGSGKSTFMRSLYANYQVDRGEVWIKHRGQWHDVVTAQTHELMDIRRYSLGYVSQFLRVIPRVSAIDVAAEPLVDSGISPAMAKEKVRSLFSRLNLPERLWSVSPTTFSGGEKQRVNVARAFADDYPILLLDEPTSALDADNRRVIVQLIEEKKQQGCALIGIFHDESVRNQVCNQSLTFALHD
ncbi:phosphonate C-P lyase system protein PhnL [Synechococcus sp. PCC 7335]|uniref:phosphonate C-P lyase system protein PhnL n=1 Tax=Synechococcus sp. (strain ATCC 29403 / PCC 7335) TaxID=91464 RepID=UPI00017EE7EF|nr:phosphonate C-P lyase system protein PhnL [Synechococcus sp. PCC 7335]EDX87020.1 phosphonate C-P lyase system protein PhnL [Synechococcus sp. PCC 7335]